MITELETINLTKTFFRFLKNEGAYGSFVHNIENRDNGRALKQTFIELSIPKKRLKVSPFFPFKNSRTYVEDPIKWLYFNNENCDRYSFLSNLVNTHIDWEKTHEGYYFWKNIHEKWNLYLQQIIYGQSYRSADRYVKNHISVTNNSELIKEKKTVNDKFIKFMEYCFNKNPEVGVLITILFSVVLGVALSLIFIH